MESVLEREASAALTDEMIRAQMEVVAKHPSLRSSKRSVAFLRYIVEQTLDGAAEHLKERTIGVEVFGRDPDYDTSYDHIVRTAATELRRRLAVYYSDPARCSELQIMMPPGSYIPQFRVPAAMEATAIESVVATEQRSLNEADSEVTLTPAVAPAPPTMSGNRFTIVIVAALAVVAFVAAIAWWPARNLTPGAQFWGPILHGGPEVLVAVGDVPHGPPDPIPDVGPDTPPSPQPQQGRRPIMPFADAVTMARITSVLVSAGKNVTIRRENTSSFSDLRERPSVLIGAFNNEWSLRLTRPLRFHMAMDAERHLIYIRDRQRPDSRAWSWSTLEGGGDTRRASEAPVPDYALISRIVNSETGKVVVIVGGLYTYGTQAAGELLADPQLHALTKSIPLNDLKHNLQIVVETDVTEDTPGPPRVVAYSIE
jgi:hypothetical protein